MADDGEHEHLSAGRDVVRRSGTYRPPRLPGTSGALDLRGSTTNPVVPSASLTISTAGWSFSAAQWTSRPAWLPSAHTRRMEKYSTRSHSSSPTGVT